MASKYLLIAALCLFASGYAQAETAEASHILVKSESDCTDLKSKLDAVEGSAAVSELFQKLAKEHSTCPSGKSGGSLGQFSPGQMVKEFNDVIFDTGAVGKVEGPVKTQFGYHLILITRRGDEKMDLA